MPDCPRSSVTSAITSRAARTIHRGIANSTAAARLVAQAPTDLTPPVQRRPRIERPIMDLTMLPLVYAQAQPAAANPNSMYFLALRRWCSSLTLSSPHQSPASRLWAFLAGLGGLLVLAILLQGPIGSFEAAFRSCGTCEVGPESGSAGVARRPNGLDRDRFYRVILDGEPGMGLHQESRRLDLVMLTKSRGPGELAIEQGIFAGTDSSPRCGGAGRQPATTHHRRDRGLSGVVRYAGLGCPPAGPEFPSTRVSRRSGLVHVDLGMRRALRALPGRGPDGRQHRSAAGELPGRRGPFDPGLDAGLRRHSCWRGF